MRNGTVQYYSMTDQAWREHGLETVANHSTTSEATLWLLKYLADAVYVYGILHCPASTFNDY